MASAAARLLRAYATQVEALRRLKGGTQVVRVELLPKCTRLQKTAGFTAVAGLNFLKGYSIRCAELSMPVAPCSSGFS